MKKIAAVVLTGALAFSLAACGNKELQMNNYSIGEEAEYYYNLTGNNVSVKASVAMHPSLLNSAVTVPAFENSVSDSWYNDSKEEKVTLSLYKSMSENEAHSSDTFLLFNISGSKDNLNKGLNTDTLGKYLDRYFKSRDKKEIISFVDKNINSDSVNEAASSTVEYKIGGIELNYTPNADGKWILQIMAYYNTDVLDEDGFIDNEKTAKAEPYVSGDYAQEVIGDSKLAVDFKSVYDLFELRKKMAVIEYETQNAIYQSDRSVTAESGSNGVKITYRTGVVYKSTGDGDNTVTIKQSFEVDKENKSITYTLINPNEKVSDAETAKIISALTSISDKDSKKLLENKGTEIEIDDMTKAKIDENRDLTVSISLK